MVTWVDTHIAKNPGRRPQILLPENLWYLFWTSKLNFSALNPIKGFKGGADFDAAIQFWLDYWKKQGLDLAGIGTISLDSP